MNARTCYVTADTPRAILALVFPVLAVATGIFVLGSKGYSFTDYFRLLASGEISWFTQGVGWLGLFFWVTRFVPPAWSALWNGPCLVSGDGQNLYLPNGKRVPLASIRSVRVQRGFFGKVAHIDTTKGRVAVKLFFARASSDALLRGLSTASA